MQKLTGGSLQMLFKVFSVVVLAGMIVTACETAKEENASAEGSGSVNAPSATVSAAQPETTTSSVGSTDVSRGVRDGSMEQFQSEVGDRVFFSFDRFDLSPEARDVLERQSEWLKRFPVITITVAGHTDERGTREYNLALGERRANSVKNYLVALGVDSNRIRTVSYGKEQPVDPGSNEAAWAKNRRGVSVPDSATLSQTN
jgi:peptidoglycan-associated lipoprotein